MTASRRPNATSRPPLGARDADLYGLFADDRRHRAGDASASSARAAALLRESFPRPVTRRDSPGAIRAASASSSRRTASVTERGLLPRGAILDKYRIEALVGTGGFAAVYRATHLLLRVPVAIKLLRPRVLARDPGVARQLLEEARYAARINHPNVVRIHDVTHSEAITYIVMEYIEGRSLAKVIESSGPLPAGDVVRIAIDVAEGLRAGLEEGLIHRDIKPANILVTRGGRARIVDFGLAHAGALPAGGDESGAGRQIVGTRGYMAPEQASHPRRVDFRADVYALGITLGQALTGAPATRRFDADVVRRAPSALQPILRRMTAPHPDDRPTSYEALLADLRRLADDAKRG